MTTELGLETGVNFDRDRVAQQVADLVRDGVYIGTSSWKYHGWRGLLYTDDFYFGRSGFSDQRFLKYCLREYATVFKTVCVDAAYYRFPEPDQLKEMMELVPDDFRFALKATDTITIKTFPALPRFGTRAGKPNPDFLNASLFTDHFLRVCEPFKEKISVIIFEFSRFHHSDYTRGKQFVEQLDGFLSQLPRGWNYGVEIRNETFLHPDYFDVLEKYNATHVFNSWTEMPPLIDQFNWYHGWVRQDLIVARFLLKPGRSYEEAVKAFSPYRQIRDPYPEGREAVIRIIQYCKAEPGKRRAFLYVNNRFEGNALQTIAHVLNKVCPLHGTGTSSKSTMTESLF